MVRTLRPFTARALRGVVASLALCGVHAIAMADLKGSYSASVTLPSEVTSGKLDYKLELKDSDEARLSIKRSARIRLYRDAVSTYGDQLTFLENADTVTLTGTWSKTSDGAELNFDRVRSSQDSDDRDLTVRLFDDGKGLLVDSWDTSFFGRTNRPRFVKASRGNNNDLLAGLAVLAAGALVVNSVAHSGRSGSGEELRFETGGRGDARFGNGDRDKLDRMRLDFRRGGRGSISFDGSFRVDVKGTWRDSFNGYTFRVEEVVIDGRRSSARGDLTIEMDRNRDRRRAKAANGYFRIDDDEWRNMGLRFTSNRG